MYDQVGYWPAINQIEYHPYWQDRATVAFCNRHGILVEAYAPYGDGARTGMLNNSMWAPIAAAHGATVGQTILRYELQTGADIVIPRSHSPAHQLENLALFDASGAPTFTLNQTEVRVGVSLIAGALLSARLLRRGRGAACGVRHRPLNACPPPPRHPPCHAPPTDGQHELRSHLRQGVPHRLPA